MDDDLWDDESDYESELESILEIEEEDFESSNGGKSEAASGDEEDMNSSDIVEDESFSNENSNEGSETADSSSRQGEDSTTDKTTDTQELMKKRPAIFTPTVAYPQEDGEEFASQRRKHRRITTSWPSKKDRASGLGVTVKKIRPIVMGVKPDGKAPIDFVHLDSIKSKVKHLVSEPAVVDTMTGEVKTAKSCSMNNEVDVPFFIDVEPQPVKDATNCSSRSGQPTHKETTMNIDFESMKKMYSISDKKKAISLPIEVKVPKKTSEPQTLASKVMSALPSSTDIMAMLPQEAKLNTLLDTDSGTLAVTKGTATGADFEQVKRLYSNSVQDSVISLALEVKGKMNHALLGSAKGMDRNRKGEEDSKPVSFQTAAESKSKTVSKDGNGTDLDFEKIKKLYSNPNMKRVTSLAQEVEEKMKRHQKPGAKARVVEDNKNRKTANQTSSSPTSSSNKVSALSTRRDVEDVNFDKVKRMYSKSNQSITKPTTPGVHSMKIPSAEGTTKQFPSTLAEHDKKASTILVETGTPNETTFKAQKDSPTSVVRDDFDIVKQLYSVSNKDRERLVSHEAVAKTTEVKKKKKKESSVKYEVPSIITFESEADSSTLASLVKDVKRKTKESKQKKSKRSKDAAGSTKEEKQPRSQSRKDKNSSMAFEEAVKQKKMYHDMSTPWTFDDAVMLKKSDHSKRKNHVSEMYIDINGSFPPISKRESRDQSPFSNANERSVRDSKKERSRRTKRTTSSKKSRPRSFDPVSFQVVNLQEEEESESFF